MNKNEYPLVFEGYYSDFQMAVASAEANAECSLCIDSNDKSHPYEIEYFIGKGKVDDPWAVYPKYIKSCPIIVKTIVFEDEASKQAYIIRKQKKFNQKIIYNENR